MYSRLVSSVVVGIDARSVEIQCDVTGGLPAFQVVGLPEKEVSESRERVRSAIKNSGFYFPARRITANLAPADLRKEGVGFDLPIALAILLASNQIESTGKRYLIVGELSLNGEVRPVPGVLPISMLGSEGKYDGFIVPEANASEAALVEGLAIYPVRSLAQAAAFIAELMPVEPFKLNRLELLRCQPNDAGMDLSDVKGQEMAKRALEIAAAGGHNAMMSGPPGAGKSMLAHCLPGILPTLSFEEALEVTRIYSIVGLLGPETPIITMPPFRAPHHTISYAGMVGGGHGLPRPGEITLAHHGVLFLDEIPEFERHVLETLRQPLEDRSILLSRAGVSIRYPASFTLIGAMNPCPCGHLGDHTQTCTCTLGEIKRYRKRLSGPFLDRVDLFVEVPRLTPQELLTRPQGEGSKVVKERVTQARRIQLDRFKGTKDIFVNSQLSTKGIENYCRLDKQGRDLIELAIVRLGLSARAYTRTLKVARTIADLDSSEHITSAHLAEAIQYRSSDNVL